MADVTRYNFQTTDILKDVKTKLETATGVDVFIGARPTNNKKQRDEMVVVSLPYTIRNNGAYQSTYMRIEIIVKDKVEGRSNIVRLEELANEVIGLFPMSNDRYNTKVPNLVLSGKDTIGYTIWYLQGGVIISKLDTYNTSTNN